VLRVDLEGAGGTRLSALNTHLDAFAQGTDAMRRQVDRIREILETVSRDGFPWVLGGDFNLLPSRAAYDRLAPGQQSAFQPDTELATLLERYRSVPSPAQADGPERQRWYTAFPNDPSVPAPDRTIDYLFLSNRVALARGWVRQADTLRISDHFPVGAEVSLRPE
jgi:endonuclease/exonuclease/phosphatase family metal-dependent hydrolase